MSISNLFGTTNESKLATKYGLIIGALFTIIGVAKFGFGLYSIGTIHFLKYLILLGAIFLGAKKLPSDFSIGKVMSFGFKIAIRTALFNTLFSSIIVFLAGAGFVESVIPIENTTEFLVNIMASFWGTLIFGALSTYFVARGIGKI